LCFLMMILCRPTFRKYPCILFCINLTFWKVFDKSYILWLFVKNTILLLYIYIVQSYSIVYV
jgi:hypothetical protein